MVIAVTRVMGCVVAVALLVVALWCWGQAGRIAEDARRAEFTMWASRSAALACAAGAQVLVLSFAVGAIYRLRWIDDLLRLAAGFVCTMALVGAIAMLMAVS